MKRSPKDRMKKKKMDRICEKEEKSFNEKTRMEELRCLQLR